MSLLAGLLLFVGTVIVMEAVAYALHRWVMHSRLGWTLHQSHHRERTGWFERNDLYGVLFAIPSVLLIYAGLHGQLGDWATWVGAGIAFYGLIYFGFHDVIVHGRELHHAVESRDGAVSFGFIYAPRVERLKQALAASRKAEVRAPRRRAEAESTGHPEERA
jgi:beta-carotene 3-hydroxylase